MEKLLSVVLLLLLLPGCLDCDYSSSIAGERSKSRNMLTINGVANLKDKEYTSLGVNGAAHFKNVKVSKDLKINGALSAEYCIFHNVTLNGGVSITHSEISGATEIIGGASFQNSHAKSIIVTAEEISLSDSMASLILVKKQNDWPKQQKVKLNNTVINGDVRFEQEGGIVVLTGSSKINGKVIGGTVKK